MENLNGTRKWGQGPIRGTGLRLPTTFEQRRDSQAAIDRWKAAQSQPISDRRAGSEPRAVDYDEPQGDDVCS